jgi:hypothetical protein
MKQLEASGKSPLAGLPEAQSDRERRTARPDRVQRPEGCRLKPSDLRTAIGETDEWTDALKQFHALSDHSMSDIHEHLAIDDIRATSNVLMRVATFGAGQIFPRPMRDSRVPPKFLGIGNRLSRAVRGT